MSNYIVPQTLVFHEFNLVPQASQRPLRAHIAGGHAFLVRYNEAAEREDGWLGYYDATQNSCYAWPHRPTGAVVDSSYTKLFIKNALLKYFSDAIGSASDIKTVVGYPNRIRSATVKFAANGTSYPRSTNVLPERDVRVGDVARVRAVVSGNEYVLWTKVAGLVGDTVSASVGSASGDAANATSTSLTVAAAKVAGPNSDITITTIGGANYDGLPSGRLAETYTLRATASSVGGNLATAKFRITSASGTDDVAEVSPNESGVLVVGTRGLTVTFAEDVSFPGTTPQILEGQVWVVNVQQAFSAPTATSGGTYAGPRDCTYIVTVQRGGTWATAPQIRVTTDNGSDVSHVTTVTAASTAVAIGSFGTTISFAGSGVTGLRTGDVYYVPVTAAKAGDMKTIVLANNLPPEVLAANTGSGVEVGLDLYIPATTLEVTRIRNSALGTVNWAQSATEITVQDAIEAYDDSWTVAGEPAALPIAAGPAGYNGLYVEYRAWLSTLADNVHSIQNVSQLDSMVYGDLDPDNPLKWALYKALQNNNGVDVRFTAVADPSSTASWLKVLDLIDDRTDVFGLVPLTRNQEVLAAYQAHVTAASSPEQGRWRVAWFNAEGPREKLVVGAATSSNGNEVKATITDDPLTSGTQYTLLTVAVSGSQPNGLLVTNGVRPGDLVRINFATDALGQVTYDEYVVDSVLNQDTLRLVSGPSAAISTARKIEIWRVLTAADLASEVARQAGVWGNKWVRCVWPDRISGSGVTMEGFHLCAALASLSSGILPHQDLTRLEIAGFDDVSRTTQLFNRSQLDTMAGAGVFIVTQGPDGRVFTRHALTTGDPADANARSEMVVRNASAISYYLFELLDPYIGQSNITNSLIGDLYTTLDNGLSQLASQIPTRRLGPQLVSYEITELRPHLVLVNRLVVTLTLRLPYTLDNLEVHMVI